MLLYLELLVLQGQVDVSWLAQASREELLALLPMQFLLATEDMKMAYRQAPVHPVNYCCNVVAFYDYTVGAVRFLVLYGHPFGLRSAVNNFSRAFVFILLLKEGFTIITVRHNAFLP